jgi:hypothetical protein
MLEAITLSKCGATPALATTAMVGGAARPPIRAIIRLPVHNFVETCSPGTFHISAILLTPEVVVLLLDSGKLAVKAVNLGKKSHELYPLE